jgi:predicted HTH domain antitoxin
MSALTKEYLKLLIPHYYKSEEELVEEAFRIIIRNNPKIRVELALELYKNNKASLAKSAEIAGLTTIEFKDVLADRCIAREIEGDEIAEIDEKIQEVWG